MSGLYIPPIREGADLLGAALAYANGGSYIGPLRMGPPDASGKRPDAKNPGAVLGKNWQSRTTKDRDEICELLIGTSQDQVNGIFLHAGRSGAVIFDVDHPENVPPVLARALWFNWEAPVPGRIPRVPYQSTRPGEPGRGHYLMLQPADRVLGNGHGTLGSDWGEVRGNNGIIVIEPTPHESNSGCYRWETCGPVPPLTTELDACLPTVDASAEEVGSASDDRIQAFWERHKDNSDNENLIKGPLRAFEKEVKDGASRHDTATKIACQLTREGALGYYSPREAIDELFGLFEKSLAGTPRRWAGPEFKGIVAWAVAQAETIDIETRRREMDERLQKRDERIQAKRTAAEKPAEEPERDPFGLLKPDPAKYFADKSAGLDVEMLAADILDLGPLAMGREGYFWEYADGVWKPNKKIVQRRAVALLGPRYRHAHATNAEDVVGANIYDIHCDPVADYLNCRNGMLNWRTGNLEPHDPGYFSTVQFPWDWDPDATCPKFNEFIGKVLSPDYAELCWQMIGYLLYSGNPRQVAFMLRGEGGEGKGTLLRVITQMLGTQNVSTESLTALNVSKFSAINLFGKIANIAGDIEAAFQTETNVFKALTGEDMIGAEHKYGQRFNFASWAVPVFSANKIPGSADVTKGYLRRWLMIKFNKPIAADDVIVGYSDMLAGEIQGIALKSLKYLRHVIEHGFKRDGEVADGLEEFAMSVDQVRLWIDECCETTPLSLVGQPHRVPRTELYKSYRAWGQESGIGILKAHEFYNRLESAGFKAAKVGGVRYHEGIKVVVLAMSANSYDKSSPDSGDTIVDRWSTTG